MDKILFFPLPDAGAIVANQVRAACGADNRLFTRRLRQRRHNRAVRTLRALELIPSDWKHVALGLVSTPTGAQFLTCIALATGDAETIVYMGQEA